MYGTQTRNWRYTVDPQFENDVKMYGTQTVPLQYPKLLGLRMM